MFAVALLALAGAVQADIIQVTGSLSGTTTWHATNEYVLSGKVYVLSNAVLRIEPGTVVKGKPGGTNDASALFICQHGKIYAEGTPENPIIFTAEADDVTDPGDLGIYARGLWGGVVLLGNATINQAADAAGNAASPKYEVYEGLSDIQVNGQYVHRFGGTNDADDSGVLRYVSIRHGGVRVLPNKEINGLSLGGVGRGTVIDHVETYAIADDGFEFFGGTVNTKYLVSAFCDDDAFDADMGYNGKNQFWLAIQERGAKDNGAEFNGEINGSVTGNYQPIANYEVYNATWIGAGTNTAGNRALQLRDYAAPRIYNSILTEFGGYGVRVDAASASHMTNGLLDLRDNLWWNFATNGVALPQVWETAQAAVLFETARSNEVANPMLRGISRTNEPAFGLDPRPAVGSPALTSNRTAPNDGFYTPVSYKGAFNHRNWATDWTALGDYGFLSSEGAGQNPPSAIAPPVQPDAPALVTSIFGGQLVISFASQNGFNYQLESNANLQSPQWTAEGAPQAGTGATLTISLPMADGNRYFRVRAY